MVCKPSVEFGLVSFVLWAKVLPDFLRVSFYRDPILEYPKSKVVCVHKERARNAMVLSAMSDASVWFSRLRDKVWFSFVVICDS